MEWTDFRYGERVRLPGMVPEDMMGAGSFVVLDSMMCWYEFFVNGPCLSRIDEMVRLLKQDGKSWIWSLFVAHEFPVEASQLWETIIPGEPPFNSLSRV